MSNSVSRLGAFILCGAVVCSAIACAGAKSKDPQVNASQPAHAPQPAGGWINLFDGKSLNGWRANENRASWYVENGAIVSNGKPRSHLFYTGTLKTGSDRPFKNFEFQAEVMTLPNSNAGVYIHTQYQEEGWPKYGYEVQVNNTHSDPIKTGSLYSVVNVNQAPAQDNEWFTLRIIVNGKRIITQVNGKTLVDYTEPPGKQPGADFTRVLTQGTFALQAHDPNSKVYFRNIKVRRLS